MSETRQFIRDGLHDFVLVGFAIAQPLFAVLSEGATFFVAHGSKPVDVFLLVAVLCVGLPAAIVLGEFLVGLINHTARKQVHFCVVVILLTILALPVLKKFDGIPGIACVIAAATVGLVVAAAYYRFEPLRMLGTMLVPAIFVFPGIFLFHGPVSEIVWSGSGGVDSSYSDCSVTIGNPAPIVFIMFDEFPSTSLMDEQRRIDPTRYPHLAAFSKEATWFRNATTVHPQTAVAVPSVLTGKFPEKPGWHGLATTRNHPTNLFTLLGKTHDVYAFEECCTDPCPAALNQSVLQAAFEERMHLLASDLWVLYRHIMVPRDLVRDGFPDLSTKWADFRNRGKGCGNHSGQVDRLRKIIARFHPTSRPSLYYAHILLPHAPYIYGPSGERYVDCDAKLAVSDHRCWQDEPAVTRDYQRHLLQVGCTDTLVGELMDHLKQVGLYDDALIVLTADHGVCHRAGEYRREVRRENLADIMPVPLLIKSPHQKEGTISDRNVESVDILPTIAGILGMELPCPVDGGDALDPLVPERPHKVIYQCSLAAHPEYGEPDGRIFVDAAFEQKYLALDRKLKLFGSGNNPSGIYKLEPHDRLVVRPQSTSVTR